MSGDILMLLGALGIGGAVGAILALAGSAKRLKAAWETFSFEFRSQIEPRRAEFSGLVSEYESLSEEMRATNSALAQVKRAFKIR